MKKLLNTVIYSEFQESDWHAYWDTTLMNSKNGQLITFYHINVEENLIVYSYRVLKKLLDKGDRKIIEDEFPKLAPLKDGEAVYLMNIVEKFIHDVEANFT